MIARNVSAGELNAALVKVNERYEGNIIFKRCIREGRGFRFTLTVKSSKGPGARRGFTGQRIAAACWHVHGHYFDVLFGIAPDAAVYSRGGGNLITRHGGNWQDWNAGSMVQPAYMSSLCDCGN